MRVKIQELLAEIESAKLQLIKAKSPYAKRDRQKHLTRLLKELDRFNKLTGGKYETILPR